jgi:Flp pilus assembly pilin Flp
MFINDLSKFSNERGQGMTEYIIIVALVAVAAIAVYQSFGQVIRAQTAAIASELAGEDGSEASQAARRAAGQAVTQKGSKSLRAFGADGGGSAP